MASKEKYIKSFQNFIGTRFQISKKIIDYGIKLNGSDIT